MMQSFSVRCVEVLETLDGREVTFARHPLTTSNAGIFQRMSLFLSRSSERPEVGKLYVITLSEDLRQECSASAA